MNDNIQITAGLATAILTFLRNGGSHLEGGLLADMLVDQANAPQREAARQAEIEAAVAEAVKGEKPSKAGSMKVNG
jgi:hypothetical protein